MADDDLAVVPARGARHDNAAFVDLSAIAGRLQALGAKPAHHAAVLRAWLHGRPLESGSRPAEAFLPATLRRALPGFAGELDRLARLHVAHPSTDGSERWLVALADGMSVESVLLPRDGLCVSTQVGCAVGCVFCMTGRGGLVRQLGSVEIVAQVVLARRVRPVKKVVFMGMGEPAHNLDAVIEAIALLGGAGGVAHKNLVLSTVGDRRVFDRLPRERVKPALALSLHTTSAAKRALLLPRAPRLDPAELVALGEDYARATGYPIQYQWTLLAGVNDGDDEIEAVAQLLAGRYAVLNLIPWNVVAGSALRRPAWERTIDITRALNARGVLTKLRDSAGQDVDGGCGQLRARAVETASVAER